MRRVINGIRAELTEERISRNEAAERVVALARDLGLRAVELEDFPEPIEADELGVVCWMAVLPAA